MFLKAKLSSRKFWAAIINSIINMIIFCTSTDDRVCLIALVLSAAGFIFFIILEGIVDTSSIDSSVIHHHMVHHYDDENQAEEDETEDPETKDENEG